MASSSESFSDFGLALGLSFDAPSAPGGGRLGLLTWLWISRGYPPPRSLSLGDPESEPVALKSFEKKN